MVALASQSLIVPSRPGVPYLGLGSSLYAPRGSEDDEFDDDSGGIPGGWTEVVGINPAGAYVERGDALYYNHTATGENGALHALVKPHTFSAGDYADVAMTTARISNDAAMGLVISDGTAHGSGAQVIVFPHNGFVRLQAWSNWTTGGTSGNNYQWWGADRTPHFAFYRLKFEAANTWGLYVSYDGLSWATAQNNFATTLTPTHWGPVFINFSAPGARTIFARWHNFRVNATY